jgi:membrane-bound lytic murein transglycosylase D
MPHAGRPGRVLLAALLASGVASTAWAQASPAHPFEVPASLRPNISFWVRVYAEWDTTRVAIHDTQRLDVIYRVLDLADMAPLPGDGWSARNAKAALQKAAVTAAREEVREALLLLDQVRPESAKGLQGVAREVFLAWEGRSEEPDRFGLAAGRVRSQRGMSERFAAGYRRSGRFMGAVEKALADAGHPPGLVAVAYAESLWVLDARSVSGAVGPWQFLKGTGREYMAVNALVDERRDPVIATLAAARYLRNSKERLGSWGAAITAYNYGTNGMARAVKQLGTSDIETILARYETGKFGFAAKNYYAEVLAALHVVSHAEAYFPGVKPQPPWVFDTVALPVDTTATRLQALGLSPADLAELNPGLTAESRAGTVTMPRGFTLRVPAGMGAKLLLGLAGTPAVEAPRRLVAVRKGQTLHAVARTHGVSLGELCAANHLSPNDRVTVGQQLVVPVPRAGFTPLPEARTLPPTGGFVAVTLPPGQDLLPHDPALRGQRPGPPAVPVAWDTVPGVDAHLLALVAASPPSGHRPSPPAVPPPLPDETLAVVLLDPEDPGPPPVLVHTRDRRAVVVAGPPVEALGAFWPLDGVDVLAGAPDLPAVDVPSPEDGAPPPPTPAHPTPSPMVVDRPLPGSPRS